MPRTKTAATADKEATTAQAENTQVFRAARERYRLLSEISASPTSSVWRAHDTVSGTEVVVKRLNPASARDPIARRRLEDEAAASELVSHPNAVPVLDELFGKDEAALVFPYVPGGTLAERLRHGVPMQPRDAARVALDLADVLAVAHSAGVVHRDVKPANILLGDDGRTRLVDFGIARAFDDPERTDGEGLDIEMTGSGMAVGTLAYMAPEQLTGGLPSPAADVYSIGVVLYEMLAGSRPYAGASPAEQLKLQRDPPPPIAGPEALTSLATNALDPIPDRRPTAAQFGRSLTAWLDGRAETEAGTTVVPVVAAVAAPLPVVAAVPAPLPLTAVPRRPRPRLVAIAAAVVVALALGSLAMFGLGTAPDAGDGATIPPGAAAPQTADPTLLPTQPAAVGANKPTTTRSAGDGRSDQANPKKGDDNSKGRHNKGHRKH